MTEATPWRAMAEFSRWRWTAKCRLGGDCAGVALWTPARSAAKVRSNWRRHRQPPVPGAAGQMQDDRLHEWR
jgi:hypothetical protein